MKTRKMSAGRVALTAALLVLALALVPAALAGKPSGGGSGGGGGGKGGKTTTPTYSGTLGGPGMVVDSNANGAPNAGDTVTFNVTSTAPYPFVRLNCSQNGSEVLQETQGFYSGWLWGTSYYLGGMAWTGGAASCVATLYSQSATGTIGPTEATLSFTVGA